MSKKRLLFARRTTYLLMLISVVGLAMWIFVGINQSANDSTKTLELEKVDENWQSRDPSVLSIGNPDAEVTIVEYSDFKCPECGKFHSSTGKKIYDTYVQTGLIRVVFRPYPVYSGDGVRLLRGSYCAQEQGLFTQFHRTFFDYMWNTYYQYGQYEKAIDQIFVGDVRSTLFKDIGLDEALYDTCVQSGKYDQAYQDDLMRSGPDEIQGTPSFIIGQQKVVGNQPYSVYKALIDIELSSQ